MAKLCLAKAMYDNVAETSNELAFRKGDVLAVLMQAVDGLEGWWLCSFRGKQGIVPGNRLRLLAGMYPEAALMAFNKLEGQSVMPDIAVGTQDYDTPREQLRTGQSLDTCSFSNPATPTSTLQRARQLTVEPDTNEPCYDVPLASAHERLSGQSSNDRSGLGSQGQESKLRELARDALYDIPQHLVRSMMQTTAVVPDLSDFSSSPSRQDGLASTRTPIREIDYDIPLLLRARLGQKEASPPAVREPAYDALLPAQQQLQAISSAALSPARSSRSSGDDVGIGSWRSSDQCSTHSGASSMSIRGSSGMSMMSSPSPRCSLELHADDAPLPGLASAYFDKAQQASSVATTEALGEGEYDEPRPSTRPATVDRYSPPFSSMSKRSIIGVVAPEDIYDRPSRLMSLPIANSTKSAIALETDTIYDVPTRDAGLKVVSGQPSDGVPAQPAQDKILARKDNAVQEKRGTELALQLDVAMELLVKLLQDITTSTTRLLSFVKKFWRKRENLESILYEVKMACMGVQTSLQEFVEFAHSAVANSTLLQNKSISIKLASFLEPVENKLRAIDKNMIALFTSKWQIALLEEAADKQEGASGAYLDSLVNSSRDLIESVSSMASLIQGNSTLLFKRAESSSSAHPQAPQEPQFGSTVQYTEDLAVLSSPTDKSSMDEYDYISIECPQPEYTKQAAHQRPAVLATAGDVSNKATASMLTRGGRITVSDNDRQYLVYYLVAIDSIAETVAEESTKLALAIKRSEEQSAAVVSLVPLSKSVIVHAHRLVYIGETLSRNVMHTDTRNDITNAANELCSSLKNAVVLTKEAATAAVEPTPSALQKAKTMQALMSRVKEVQRAVVTFRASVRKPINT